MNYIYKITNKVNRKAYIGLTTKGRPTDRFSQHRYLARHPEQLPPKSNSLLYSAMRKYGIENFSFEIVEEVPEEKDLGEREQYWIAFYHTYIKDPKCWGYNLTEGGEGAQGYSRIQSLEERKKRSESGKQFFINHPEAKTQISKRTKKLWEDEEYRKKVTESNKRFYAEHPDKFKGKNNPFYGKTHSEESLQKIKEASKKYQKKLIQLDKDTLQEIQIFDGVKDAEKALGVSHGWLSKAARQNKIAYGFRWKFFEKV